MKSLALLITVFFPLIAPLWEKGPLNSENTMPPEALTHLEDRQLDELATYFKQSQDPRMRSSLAMDLGNSNNPYAEKIAMDLLAQEKNDLVKEDILCSLQRMRDTQNISTTAPLKALFTHHSPQVRAYAASIYLRKSGDGAAIVSMLAEEEAEFPLNTLLAELAKRPECCPQDKLLPLLESKNTVKRAGAAYSLALNAPDPDAIAPLSKLISDKDVSVRVAIAKGLAGRKKEGGNKLFEALATDSNSSVRSLTASSAAHEAREKTLIKLAGDPDYEVRRAACVSLSNRSSEPVLNTLIARLADSSLLVRSAAEDSLGTIKPGKDFVQKIAAAIAVPESRDSAIRCLGLLKAEEHAALIVDVLEKTDSSESAFRCAQALGMIKHKPGAAALAAKSSFADARVRIAVALALGELAVKDSFPALEKLAADKEQEVCEAAFKAMGIIGDPSFSPLLGKQAVNFSPSLRPEYRASACWGLARTGTQDSGVMNGLKDLCTKEVIAVNGMKSFDADFARAAGLFALAELTKKNNPAAQKTFDEIINWFKNPPPDKKGMSSDALMDYVRQAELFAKGQKAEPVPVPVTQLEPAMAKFIKK